MKYQLSTTNKALTIHRLALIERDPSSYGSRQILIEKKRIPELSVQEVVNKYQGFQGEDVCFFEIDVSADEFKEKLEECLRIKELGVCFLLHVVSGPPSEAMSSLLKGQAIKLGYDVGICEEESTIYSSIFQEVLFGGIDELVMYKDSLNEDFLFQDKALAEKYVDLHNQMSAQGKDVEDYMEMIIYEIWKHKD